MSTYNFEAIKRGDTFNGLAITLTDGAVPTPNPIDLTGFVVRIMFRTSLIAPPSITLLMDNTTPDPDDLSNGIYRVISIPDAAGGELQIGSFVVSPLNFNVKNEFTNYLYDIEFSDGVNIKTWVSGVWKVITDVTR